uniref:Uncharacterized protein n=1 Tax=Glossina pallidipes TaxID=7398 RepID=A0A1B0A2B8_GLOPL
MREVYSSSPIELSQLSPTNISRAINTFMTYSASVILFTSYIKCGNTLPLLVSAVGLCSAKDSIFTVFNSPVNTLFIVYCCANIVCTSYRCTPSLTLSFISEPRKRLDRTYS